MDIEGWEIAALEGARSHLDPTSFIVELHPDAWQWSGHTRGDLEGLLKSAGLSPARSAASAIRLGSTGRLYSNVGSEGPSPTVRAFPNNVFVVA